MDLRNPLDALGDNAVAADESDSDSDSQDLAIHGHFKFDEEITKVPAPKPKTIKPSILQTKLSERHKQLAEADGLGRSDDDQEEADDENAVRFLRQSKPAADEPSDPVTTVTTTADFFSENPFEAKGADGPLADSFVQMQLSRPLLKAVTALGFTRPTPVQAHCIPLALTGKDICASAQTGSGKTAAFLLPVLERLLYRSRQVAVTRVLIIAPTRELAAQILNMTTQLAQFSDVRGCLIVGGLSTSAQLTELKTNPDIIVCTPGRMIDHLRNSPSFHVDTVEVLVMDEADRLLDLGFTDELHELVKYCPRGRQTMLFSATMTEGVEELVNLSLNRPIRVKVDNSGSVADRLVQEFVRVREHNEGQREAMVLSLCKRSCNDGRVIIFCNEKKKAHRLLIVFGLVGLKAAELHGNLNQRQRQHALEQFRNGDVDFLIATDLAGRGIDIEGTRTVINVEMPQVKRYIHRVGRTARAGLTGRSITLVGERNRVRLRSLMKGHVKNSAGTLKSRLIPPAIVNKWVTRIANLEPEISKMLDGEKLERKLLRVEMESIKAGNLLLHEKEITSRPARTWFKTEREKTRTQRAAKSGSRAHKNTTTTTTTTTTNTRSPGAKTSKKRKPRWATGRNGPQTDPERKTKSKSKSKRKRR